MLFVCYLDFFRVLNRNTTSSATVTFLVHLSKVGFHSITYLTALLDKKNNCKPEIALNDASLAGKSMKLSIVRCHCLLSLEISRQHFS